MRNESFELSTHAGVDFSPRTAVEDTNTFRRIYFTHQNIPLSSASSPQDEPDSSSKLLKKYCTNYVSTTKYSIWTFVPVFLYEQFHRYSNCFFLLIGLLQQIPDVSPTGRYTTIVPLFFILMVSAVKEIIEDYKRLQADREINNRKVDVYKDGNWESIPWKKVEVGNIVKVENESSFPADLILLSSSEPQAMCYIETSNLDGETNLKIRQGHPQTSVLLEHNDLNHFGGYMDCEEPHFRLYEFNGSLAQQGKSCVPLGPEQMLLRGAKLKNTNWIFGVVAYTGIDSKLMLNSARAPMKRSSVDRMTNKQILSLFLILILICVIGATLNCIWNRNNMKTHWYIGIKDDYQINFFYNFLTFLILFNNLIPISLQVSLEVVRYIQAIFINKDLEMYDSESNTPAMARTSNLNEELGQIKFVFSDKTGTLTKNIMEFKKCIIADDVYGIEENPYDSRLVKNIMSGHVHALHLRDFLTLMAVCHTVIPEKGDDSADLAYHASSPDERALVEGACKFGFKFVSRTPEKVTVDILGELYEYEILNVLEFTSPRKRMSVVVRTPDGKIKLYCKGADNVIYERLSKTDQQFTAVTLRQLEIFATEGLRTLCLAVADISEEFYDEWKNTYFKASLSLQNRDQHLSDAANLIEINLRLLGATAIEDKLQDGVPDAIEKLLNANIHVWILTGDKRETAINIGYSCRLLQQRTKLLILSEGSLDRTREKITDLKICCPFDSNEDHRDNDYALIIDGKTLTYALTYEELRQDFLDICISCRSVICCRVSPLQKAEVVDYVTTHTSAITLAIGDGANDVAMIQKANVGVGISGVEGLQACCASDYAIAQFRFLIRLLFVHGAWNYNRISKLILYSFYKNVCLYVIELWYAYHSGWSGQILFERWTIGFYNVFFTAAPPLAMGIFDRLYSEKLMTEQPSLYKISQSGKLFNVKVFWFWLGNALYHSIFLYWLTLSSFKQDVVWNHGREGGYLVLGNTVYSYVVVTVCFKAALSTDTWTRYTGISIFGSILAWFLFLYVYSCFWPTFPVGAVMTRQFTMVMTSPVFWFGLVLIPPAALLLDFSVKLFNEWVNSPKGLEVDASEREYLSKTPDKQNKLSEKARLLTDSVKKVFLRTPSDTNTAEAGPSRGYAFSQEEGGAVTQAAVIRKYNTHHPKPSGK